MKSVLRYWCWCPSRGEGPNGGTLVFAASARDAATRYASHRAVGRVSPRERLRINVRSTQEQMDPTIERFLVRADGGGVLAQAVEQIRKDETAVLLKVFGPYLGWRLATLPTADPDRQAALAEAALAGEVVGDSTTLG